MERLCVLQLETALATLVTTWFRLADRREINRNDLLEYKETKINKRVPLVLTYHPSLEKIAGIVRLSVIIGKKLKKVKRWPSCSLNHLL
jgi:hypothetical protein